MSLPLPPTDVLVAYLEPVVDGSRVVVIGDAESGAAELFLELGARAVHVFDPDAARAKRAPATKGVTIAALPANDFDVRDGAFDVALVPDLSVLADPPASLARLRRVLGQGTLLVAAPNPEALGRGIGYYELYDLVALQFATVKMIAAVPFTGTTLAELGEGDPPDVSVDTQLAGTPPPPVMFCAAASQREELELAPYAIIQTPPTSEESDQREQRQEKEDKTDPGVLALVESALAEARLRIEVLEGRIKEQQSDHKKKIREIEGTLAEAQIRADALERELEESRKLDRTAELEAALEELRNRPPPAPPPPTPPPPPPEPHDDEEVARLEAKLKEQGANLAAAQKEVERRAAMVKELLLTVEQSQSQDDGLMDKLDALALELARKHGELEAARWRIAELEQKAAAPSRKPDVGELDVLREALQKEHAAREKAESGEALAQARAELQRQAVLIDQLSRDPSR